MRRPKALIERITMRLEGDRRRIVDGVISLWRFAGVPGIVFGVLCLAVAIWAIVGLIVFFWNASYRGGLLK